MDELEQLHAQIADLQRKAETLASKKKAEVLEEVKAKIRTYGITLKDLGLTDKPKTTSTVAVKYRHPSDPSLAWTGRGRQPRWIEAYISEGGSLQDLAV